MQSKTFVSLAGFTALLSISTPAYAYLDPATGSIILQATIGAIASATFFFRTSLYRVKEIFARSKQPGTDQE